MADIQITLRDILNSPNLEDDIHKKFNHIQSHGVKVQKCHVIVEYNKKHNHKGKLFNVRIEATANGKTIAITKKIDADVYIALRDAFSALERKLEDNKDKRKGRVKSHQETMHGHIKRILPEEGYGFIGGIDNNEYYFSLTNVIHPGFKQLAPGDLVEYLPIFLNQSWQANHVTRKLSVRKQRPQMREL